MSAKSAVKVLCPDRRRVGLSLQMGRGADRLEERAERGAGFFVGGFLAVAARSEVPWRRWPVCAHRARVQLLLLRRRRSARPKRRPPSQGSCRTHPASNWLSPARLALFAARDVWFVVSVPIFLARACSRWSVYAGRRVHGSVGTLYAPCGARRPLLLARVMHGRARTGARRHARSDFAADRDQIIPIGSGFNAPPALTTARRTGAVLDRVRVEFGRCIRILVLALRSGPRFR